MDKEVYYGRGMIVITYVDDCLLFGPDIKEIQNLIKELGENGNYLNGKDGDKYNVFDFLGVGIKTHKESKMLVLTQTRLIENILDKDGMSD